MTRLNWDVVDRLDGEPIGLSSEASGGKLLSVDAQGNISFQPEGATEYDQKWHLLRTDNEISVVSEREGYAVCTDRGGEPSGDVVAVRCDDPDRWKIGTEGELYHDEKYLWMAKDKLYASHDGFVSEQWVPVFEERSASTVPYIMAAIAVIAVIATAVAIAVITENRPSKGFRVRK